MPPLEGPPDLCADDGTAVDRRGALKLFAAGAAALASGCRRQEEMLPYRDMPEYGASGDAVMFATALPLAGAARGVLVESHQGRPTKVHGNPDHPASRGGTDAFAEAELLALFDPSRTTSPVAGGTPVTWSAVAERLRAAVAENGTALLTGPVGSPTLARQVGALMDETPGLRWFTHRGAAPALEVPAGPGPLDRMQLWPDWASLDAVVTLGADPLGPGPAQVAMTKGWSEARRARRDTFRLFAFEPVPTLTGTKADRRTPVAPADLSGAARDLRDALEGGDAPAPIAEAARALTAAEGRACVLPGPDLPPETLALIEEINRRLAAPMSRRLPFWRWPALTQEDASTLIPALRSGEVRRLIVLGANPAYDMGPAFEDAAADVELIHFGLREDETASRAALHAPLHHPLEDWSDLRSVDGTASLVQPLIAPLHETRSAHAVLEMLRGRTGTDPRALVQETWGARWGTDFDDLWDGALRAGVIDDFPVEDVSPAYEPAPDEAPQGTGAFAHVAQISHAVLTGEYAPNGWLQECPAPLTKQVWGNAASLSRADAGRLGIEEGDTVALSGRGQTVWLPATILPGQADGVVGTTLGYGRRLAGPIGSGVGADTAPLGPRIDVRPTGKSGLLVRTQREFGQHGREILRSVTHAEPEVHKAHHTTESFYAAWEYDSPSWGMVIDTDVCSGCNACMIACQSENNIPVVGADEVARGRHMHWIRIDAYDLPEGTGRGFQPVPCMHCEKAPCEPACPVAASVHDEQGLNAQVYNRCVGTRFCQANCPYQVRRFNFFDYADSQAHANLGADLLQAMRNPDVSVRGRGVMEKCTYCVQRIEAANHAASREDRPIADGEVVTACQSACPAEAITFGDITDPESAVSRAKDSPRHYALLEHLGTRPRTTYLARVTPEEEA
ncbi:putative ferredoxin-like protein YdhX precursor [Roseivivax jejudonensis]|uniref:Putative ferredoxin-like protein YdhX n=1 Tax=Roseivivax jejudonensis TaxID=1529041 RepID=A0A1X6ZYS3_9RHOB|nr:4Fe-4S dicluster domain-containing protein [Roseivivax jejudonensis]SLN65642.1 putative ferredoxin-like protein YdhX precursor [Roseivivax jejudonensis]